MKEALANAKIVAWEMWAVDEYGVDRGWQTVVAIRQQRGDDFICHDGDVMRERTLAQERDTGFDNFRILESFPEPTLAELIGVAQVFVATPRFSNERRLFYRTSTGKWSYVVVDDDGDYDLTELADHIDLTTVVPLL